MKAYHRSDDQFSDTFQGESAEAAAADWFSAWDATDTTTFLEVRVTGADESMRWFQRQIDPIEPSCSEDAHDWAAPLAIVGGLPENPGVYRSTGAGTRSHEVCEHCGCGRITDTWATNPSDGTEGHTTVEYRPEYAASRTAA